jgi:sulfoxide reductase heme-binding subunit YedZ
MISDEMRTKTLWIKDEYLRLILAGRKTIEVRVGYSNITRLQVGDRLLLNDQHPFVIRRIGRYASFEELLAHEDAASIAPDVPPEQLLKGLRAIYPSQKEALGVVALEIEPEGAERGASGDVVIKKSSKTWYLVLVGIVSLILVSVLISLRPLGTPFNWLIRGAALMGYLAIFLSVFSSAYMRQMVRLFGRPFIKVHHILSVTGLVLVTLHPLGVAIDSASLRVFLPRFDSWVAFLQFGGCPAGYLIAAASLAAVLRKTIGRNWRAVHILNYVAFLLVTVHAVMIGTDFQHTIVRAVSVAAALAVVVFFIQKRRQ